jgi:hypothetical protein
MPRKARSGSWWQRRWRLRADGRGRLWRRCGYFVNFDQKDSWSLTAQVSEAMLIKSAEVRRADSRACNGN